MAKKLNLKGQAFGNLTVISDGVLKPRPDGRNNKWYLCQCVCGNTLEVKTGALNSGNTKSCGCAGIKHGMSKSKEYACWRHIKGRCLNPSDQSYKNYGGRGISICDEWKDDFQAFYNHVGPAPNPSASLDRINNKTGNYEPGNVRWVINQSIQLLNRRASNLSKSGYKGVYQTAGSKTWTAEIKVNNRKINLGSFKNIEDAYQARLDAEEKYHKPLLNTGVSND